MNILTMIRTVLWSFFGIRRSAAHQADIATINLPMLPFVAVVLAACFGGILYGLARLAVVVGH